MKIKNSFLTIILLFISIIPFGLYIYCYPQFPNEIVIHYKNGIADRFVNKSSYEILIMCGLGLFGLFLMKSLELLAVKTSQFDKKQKDTMNISTIVITILFTGISIYFLIISTGVYKLSALDIIEITNVVLGILFIILGNYMPKFKQNKFFGFRTNHTLSDENVWFKTQRFSRKVWVIGGVVMIIVSVILGRKTLGISSSLSLIFLLLMTILPYIYSNRLSHMIK